MRMPGASVRLILSLLVLGGIPILTSTDAHARSFYFELGGGVSQIRGGPEFFGAGTTQVLNLGAALNFGVAAKVTPANSSFQFHLGVQHRFSSGTDAASAYSLQASYPILRFETNHVFVTVGATPFVWARQSQTLSFTGFNRIDGALNVLLEVGYEWPITPAVSFAVATAGQCVIQNGSFSFKPSLEGTAQLRFFFGAGTSFSSERESYGDEAGGASEYPGWRYPYGWTH